MSRDDLLRAASILGIEAEVHLSGRAGTWLASFAELVLVAEVRGVSVAALQPELDRLLGPDADGEVFDQDTRDALIDALVGRWAASDALNATLRTLH
jgi:hypothetical protein